MVLEVCATGAVCVAHCFRWSHPVIQKCHPITVINHGLVIEKEMRIFDCDLRRHHSAAASKVVLRSVRDCANGRIRGVDKPAVKDMDLRRVDIIVADVDVVAAVDELQALRLKTVRIEEYMH